MLFGWIVVCSVVFGLCFIRLFDVVVAFGCLLYLFVWVLAYCGCF